MGYSFKEINEQWQPFDEYEVTMTLNTIAGGIPKNPNIIKGWINATCKKMSEAERKKLVDATLDELPDVSDEKEMKSWVGFKADIKKGLYVEGRQVKAMLKEAANIVKLTCPNYGSGEKTEIGVRNLKSKVADHVFVVEDKIWLGKMKPDELEERPVHAITPMGPRSSIKRTDVIYNCPVKFTVRRFDDKAVPEETLYAVLSFCQYIGLGADRSQGHGTFNDIDVKKVKSSQKKLK